MNRGGPGRRTNQEVERHMATGSSDGSPIELLERRLEDLLSKLDRMRQENVQLRGERDSLKDRILKLIGQVDEHLGQV